MAVKVTLDTGGIVEIEEGTTWLTEHSGELSIYNGSSRKLTVDGMVPDPIATFAHRSWAFVETV